MEILIGKTPNCQYVLNDPRISRQHCKIILDGQKYFIMDLHSKNGTFVNGGKIQSGIRIPINIGDEIVLSGFLKLDWNVILSYMNKTVHAKHQSNGMYSPNYQPSSNPPPRAYPQQGYVNYPPNPSPMPPNQYQYPSPNLGNDLAYALHMNKSFVGKSFITLLLYYFGFYIGGFIANLLFFSEADRTKKITGHSPPGYGCLVFLIVTHIILPLIVVVLIVLSGGAIWHEMVHSFR